MTFRYSIAAGPGGGWRERRADRFGVERANPLLGVLVLDTGQGRLDGAAGKLIELDKDNVLLTALKPAEANGQGLILRFFETLGRDTRLGVRLPAWLDLSEARETDVVENDARPLPCSAGAFTLCLRPREWRTVRLLSGPEPPVPTGIQALTGPEGTLVRWRCPEPSAACLFELFRGTSEDFTAGTGSHLASVSGRSFLDRQLRPGAARRYFYRVRAVAAGRKGPPSAAARAVPGEWTDADPPTPPQRLCCSSFGNTRVSLSWERSTDAVSGVAGYTIHRDGRELRTIPGSMTSYLDVGLCPGRSYRYAVEALDGAGNRSARSDEAFVRTTSFPLRGNIAPLASVTASSERGPEAAAGNAVDGAFGVAGVGEWVAAAEECPWIRLEWQEPHELESIYLFGRYDLDLRCCGRIDLDDGRSLFVERIDCEGAATRVLVGGGPVRQLTLTLGGPPGELGLAEIQVFESDGAEPLASRP